MPYQSNNPPISEITVRSVQGTYRSAWHNACFLILLNGELQVEVNGHVSHLNGHAVMLVEPDNPYTVTGRGSNLVMTIRLDYDFFIQGKAGRGLGTIVCNSAEDSERDYSMLRQMLSRIALNFFEAADSKELRQLELCYSLLYYLNTTHFVETEPNLSGEQADVRRGRQIISYIESNYMHELQLEDLAGLAYLSPSYLSRMFKKMTGTNFKAYLQEVRLRHAVEDMRGTDQTITSIAYKNGFPNVSALNTAIHKKYGMTPHEFRKKLGEEPPRREEEPPYQEVEYTDVRTNLKLLAGSEPPRAMELYRYPDRIEYNVDNVTQVRAVPAIWKTMINVGTVRSLDSVGMWAHLKLVQGEVGFKYARLEGVLTDASIPVMSDGKYNFSYFDRTISMLQTLGTLPFLDLSPKTDYLLLSESEVVYRGGKPCGRVSEKEVIDKASALIRHCINTFGISEVERWGVEISLIHDEMLNPLETPEEFARRFHAMYTMIKDWLPGMQVGGPEYNIAMEGVFLQQVITLLGKRGIRFDFLSLCAVPYTPTWMEDGNIRFVVSPNPNYIRDSVRAVRDMLESMFTEPVPIWVTVLGTDVRNRNYVNDSCYQASFIAKNTIDLVGLADVIGYWQLSDMDAEYIDTLRILFGGTGILSKDGLKKPGFTVLRQLGGINTFLVEKTGEMMVTTNAVNTYNVVLYNYAHFTNMYCLTNGEGITTDNVYTVFGDAATKNISVKLSGVGHGRYKVVTTTLNRESGSLFDEWMRYGIIDDLQPHDINYLQDIVHHPHRAVRYQECTDGTMELTMQMLPHEVKFLLLIREM